MSACLCPGTRSEGRPALYRTSAVSTDGALGALPATLLSKAAMAGGVGRVVPEKSVVGTQGEMPPVAQLSLVPALMAELPDFRW